MTRQKWVRLSLVRLQELLAQRGHPLDTRTIRRLVLKLGYSLKANRKRFTGPPHPDRDHQFRYIARLKKQFFRAGWPVISEDTKKKELIGNFKNAGQAWCEQAEGEPEHLPEVFAAESVKTATPRPRSTEDTHPRRVCRMRNTVTPMRSAAVAASRRQRRPESAAGRGCPRKRTPAAERHGEAITRRIGLPTDPKGC